MKNSRVLIIGGTGFIGKYLMKSLKANGFTDVLAVSRKNHSADISSKKILNLLLPRLISL